MLPTMANLSMTLACPGGPLLAFWIFLRHSIFALASALGLGKTFRVCRILLVLLPRLHFTVGHAAEKHYDKAWCCYLPPHAKYRGRRNRPEDPACYTCR